MRLETQIVVGRQGKDIPTLKAKVRERDKRGAEARKELKEEKEKAIKGSLIKKIK